MVARHSGARLGGDAADTKVDRVGAQLRPKQAEPGSSGEKARIGSLL